MTFILCILALFLWASTSSADLDARTTSKDSTKTTIAAVVCMIRNEADILPYWIRFYSSLFGLENIAVIDNLSDDEKTLNILSEWQSKGLKVIKFDGQFWRKGDYVAEIFSKHFSHAHLAIPADADEFLVPYVNNRPVPDKKAILDILREYISSKDRCWSMEQHFLSYNFYFNDTIGNISYFKPHVTPEVDISKKFVKLSELKSFQQGFHTVELKSEGPNSPGGNANCSSAFNRLGFLHYHNRNPVVTALRALNDISGFGYLDRRKVNLGNIADHQGLLEKWVKKGRVAAYHKMLELLAYIKDGPAGLLENYDKTMRYHPEQVVQVVPMDKIIEKFAIPDARV